MPHRLALALTIGGVGCAADLWTKQYMFRWLGMPTVGSENLHWIWPEYFGFETAINTGALFGMGHGRVGALAIISIVALLGMVWWLLKGGATQFWPTTIASGLILGGIIGNLYDRLGLWGVRGVRDWILFKYQDWVWPNFNIADCMLVCGAALLVWQAFCDSRRERQQLAAQQAASTTVSSTESNPAT